MHAEGAGVHAWGVGMPALLHLHEFGRVVHQAFGRNPVLVGSALTTKTPRDLDVRLVLPLDEYTALVGPARECGQPGTRWAAFAVAFSALAAQMTGKVVDFQIQSPAVAATYADEQALPLGYAVGRFTYGGDADERAQLDALMLKYYSFQSELEELRRFYLAHTGAQADSAT